MSADPNDDLLVDEAPSDKKVDVIVIPSADDAQEEHDDKLEKEEGDEPETDKKPEPDPEDDEPLDDELLEDAPAAPAPKKLVAKEEPPPPPKQEAKPQYTAEQWATAYDAEIRKHSASIGLLEKHMDGAATVEGYKPYDEMTPSEKRKFHKDLDATEAHVRSLHTGKANKVAEVQAAELETQVSQVVTEIARLNPAFKDCDEATRERIEGRYMKALANGSLARMDEGQFLTAMTKGITPVKVPAKNGAAKPAAPRRNTQTVRQPDSTFRVKREAPAEAAPKTRGLDGDKVRRRYRDVMGYDASPTAELEDLVETIRLNSKKGA